MEHYKRELNVLSIGKLSLKKGGSKYFNVYETWGNDSTYEIYKEFSPNKEPKYRIVVTSGTKPLAKSDQIRTFFSQSSRRYLFTGVMVDYAVGENLKDMAKKYGSSIMAYVYK